MEDDILTVEQVAAKLDLHPKTIRRFIQEGKLIARKIGKQWRITAADLEDFMGSKTQDTVETARGSNSDSFSSTGGEGDKPRIQVSAVVDILVENTEDAIRITNTLFAVMNCKDPSFGSSRCDHIFYKDEMKARYILWGTPEFIINILGCLQPITERKGPNE